MAKKQVVSIIMRDDIITVSELSVRYSVSRKKIYELIRANMLPGEVISSVFYPSIANNEAVLKAINSHSRSRNAGRRSTFKPIQPKSEQDAEFERQWREMCL
jgi:predicted DNA-binding transcriptional regulator AlpA